jgi:SLT domain-containing protein
MTQLDKITSQLTVDSANLAKDVQNLSVALGTTLNDAMATAILNAGGGQKVFDNFAKSVLTTGVNSKSTTQAGVALAQQLFDLTGNTKDAQSEFEAFAQKGLNLTAAQADALWKKVSTQLNPALQVVGTKTVPDAKNAFVDWANNSLKLSTTQSDNLWTELTAKLGPQLQTLTSKTVPAVHQVFVNWAEQSLHLTQTQAETLYQQTLPALQKEINSLQGKAVTVSVSVTGSGGEYIVSSTGAKGQVNVYPVKAAAEGWRVPGFGGGDQVHALLEPGEAVVDKYRTRQYAGLLGAMGVPGFAAGGLVTDFPGAQGTLGDTAQPYFSQLNASMLAQALTAVNKQVKQSLAQILAAGGVYLGPGSGNYAADITTVLKQLGMPLSLVTNWLAQIQTESGGNLNAVNLTDSNAQAGHPSVGLLQLIPSTFASFAGPYRNTPPLVNYGGGTVSEDPMAQIYAAIRYADIRYGGAPGMAAAIGHGHGYAAGGLVTAQAAEQAAYGRLAAGTKAALTKPDAYLKSHLKSVTGELVTLTARQAAEQVAYAAGNLSKFGTALRAELKVSQDKYLSTAEPALTGSLDAALNALLSGSSGGSSGGSSSGSSGAYRPISQDDANLLLQQAAMRPFIMSGGKYVPETLTKTGRQDYASLAEWDWLHGIAPPAKTVAAAAKPGTGGASRLLASGLTPAQYQADLKAVSGLPASAINASPHLRHIWHLLHLQHLADLAGNPYGMSRGGMVFDSGGTLAPGANLVWNRTGQPEHLTPDTGRAGTGGRHASLDDVHAALLELIGVSRQQGSRFAGAVNSSSASAAVRGSYTTRR